MLKVLKLGAELDQAVSPLQISMVLNDADILYKKHKKELIKENTGQLIELYESIIHGSDNKMGLFDCYDSYYNGCWDERLEEVEKLKLRIEETVEKSIKT